MLQSRETSGARQYIYIVIVKYFLMSGGLTQRFVQMKKKIFIGVVIFLFMFTGLLGPSNAKITDEFDEENSLDPGGIQGPIFGIIQGYEFHDPWNYTLSFYAVCVIYLGKGYGFDSGFYPRLLVFQEINWRYHFFEGVITPTYISGTISGLPSH